MSDVMDGTEITCRFEIYKNVYRTFLAFRS